MSYTDIISKIKSSVLKIGIFKKNKLLFYKLNKLCMYDVCSPLVMEPCAGAGEEAQ